MEGRSGGRGNKMGDGEAWKNGMRHGRTYVLIFVPLEPALPNASLWKTGSISVQ